MKVAMPVRYALISALLALSGCVETRFEASLTDAGTGCDTRWAGQWNEVDDRASARPDRPATVLSVDAGCVFTVIEPDKAGAAKRVRIPTRSVHARGDDYLVVADDALGGLVELQPPHAVDPPPQPAYFFARYRVRGDRIDLYTVDSARVARLVIDGKLDGTVDKRANELHVFVRGDRTRMLALVRDASVFEARPSLRLVRSAPAGAAHSAELVR